MISIYTDGSCNPVCRIGGWAAILFIGEEKILLSGTQVETTHQRMELTAAAQAIAHLQTLASADQEICIYTDSQYLVGLPHRKSKLLLAGLTTKKNLLLPNADLIQQLLGYLDTLSLTFIKVKSHEKFSDLENYNREVDKLSRKIVRDSVRNSLRKPP